MGEEHDAPFKWQPRNYTFAIILRQGKNSTRRVSPAQAREKSHPKPCGES